MFEGQTLNPAAEELDPALSSASSVAEWSLGDVVAELRGRRMPAWAAGPTAPLISAADSATAAPIVPADRSVVIATAAASPTIDDARRPPAVIGAPGSPNPRAAAASPSLWNKLSPTRLMSNITSAVESVF